MAYIFISVVIVLFAVHFYRKAKRHSVKPFPEHWHKLLTDNVLFYRNLSKDAQLIFQQKMMRRHSSFWLQGMALHKFKWHPFIS